MSTQAISLLALPVKASAAISAFRFVTPAGALAGAGANTLGVARYSAGAGEMMTVDVLGTVVVEAGASVTAGNTLKTDATGRAIPWATSGAKVAIALQDALAAGGFFEVLLIPNAA